MNRVTKVEEMDAISPVFRQATSHKSGSAMTSFRNSEVSRLLRVFDQSTYHNLPSFQQFAMMTKRAVTSEQPTSAYHTRMQKGGALLDDMRLLVRSWKESNGKRSSAGTRDVLGKKTIARSKDTFVRAFSPRFLQGDPPNAWKIVRILEDRDAQPEILRPIYYWITARSDHLLYDYVTQELIHIARTGDGSVRIDEVKSWIQKQLGKAGREWTPTVSVKVARGLLAALRDFGILEGATRKRVAPVHLPQESFCYIAFCLSLLGASGESLVHHPDWKLFLLTPSLVERLLLEAHQRNFLSFHSAGRIYRIEFPVTTHAQYADVLVGTKS